MTVYYNEFDKKKCAALRALMEDGFIAKGHIDDRSINDVRPADLEGYAQCHFFAGIGVWSAALRAAGVPDDFPVWTGSCPCQSFSSAGKKLGFADERHLWPAWLHLIRVCRPSLVFGEQVASSDGLAWDDLVQADMEGEGYARAALDLCAAGFGAPHWRQRNYWMAHSDSIRQAWIGGGWEARIAEHRAAGRLADPARIGFGGIGHADQAQGLIGSDQPQPDGLRGTGGMADATIFIPVDGDIQRIRQQRLQQADRRDAGDAGREERPATEGAIGGVANTDNGRRAMHGHEASNSDSARIAHAEQHFQNDAASPINGFWRLTDWLFCRDGKWRPVEPGTFPLAHGYPERVGVVHCAGDAIVLPQAQAYIEAGFEYLGGLR